MMSNNSEAWFGMDDSQSQDAKKQAVVAVMQFLSEKAPGNFAADTLAQTLASLAEGRGLDLSRLRGLDEMSYRMWLALIEAWRGMPSQEHAALHPEINQIRDRYLKGGVATGSDKNAERPA